MGQLIDGEWVTRAKIADAGGHFRRAQTSFRSTITPGSRFEAEPGRYHLYVALACPWAHRTLMTRALLGLESVIGVSVVEPYMDDQGWRFDAAIEHATADSLFGYEYLREVYLRAAEDFTGRVTVPILWDTKLDTIVNNESREIVRMFNRHFAGLGTPPRDLAPAALEPEIERLIDFIYEPINNGVYRAGFATKQGAYEQAVHELFTALDACEAILAGQRWLAGGQPSEVDLFLFATLIRFDLIYHTHFKCNRKRIVDYPNLWGFVRELYQVPAIASTCNFEHIRRHYYSSHPSINPHRIVAVGPDLDFDAPHDRARLGGVGLA